MNNPSGNASNPSNSNQQLSNAVTILKIRKKVLIIEKLISKNIFQKIIDQNKDNKKIKKDKDKKKKKKKNKKDKNFRTGIFDGIFNFLGTTFLGFLFTKILPLLPKVVGIIGLLKPAGKLIGFIANLFLNAVGGFIETGYKVHDQIKGQNESIKKISLRPAFDTVLSALSNTLTSVVKVADWFADLPSGEVAQKRATKPVKGAASGGVISPTRGNVPVNKPPTRELNKTKSQKVPRKQIVPETNIGKDAGGEGNIRSFYHSPKIGIGGLIGIFKPKGSVKKTPVDTISTISKTLRKRNTLFGDIASVGSDVALGQKPNKTIYKNTAKDVITLAQYISERQQEKNKDAILAMAYGGVVPSRTRSLSRGNNLVDMVSHVIQNSVEERVNKAIANFSRPVGRGEMLEENIRRAREAINYNSIMSGQLPGDDGGPPLSRVEMSGISSEDIAILGKIIQAEAGGENDTGKAAVLSVILNRYRAIKSGAAKPSQFGISGKSSKDITIKDIIFARNGQEFQPIRDGSFERISPRQGQKALERAIRAGGNDPEKLMKSLIKSGLSSGDAEYLVRSVGFYNYDVTPSSRVPFSTRSVKLGRHGFQQSGDVQLRGPIGAINAEIRELEISANLLNAHEKAKHLIVMSGQRGYRQVKMGETIPRDFLHHGREDIREGLFVRDYGITPSVSGGSQLLEGEGAPLVVPFGVRAKAIIEGSHALRFEDPVTKKVLARYHHLENIPPGINGKILDGGTFIGTQGGRPGASSAYGSSTAVHTHLEGTLEWHRAFINTYAGGLDVNKTNLPGKIEKIIKNSQREYDIIIPLDHVPPELINQIPDKRGGNTFKSAYQTGADGREREHTDTIALYVSQQLQKQGYRVKIAKPEEFGNYEDYDKFIERQSKLGTTVLPFHLDADPQRGGTGFLVRIRKNDALDKKLAESLAPVLEKYTQVFRGGQRYGGIDTQSNATINRAAQGPAALLELGSLVTLERLFGKNFTSKPEYKQFLDELTVAITQSVSKKESSPKIRDTRPGQKRDTRRQKPAKPSRPAQARRQGKVLPSRARTSRSAKPQPGFLQRTAQGIRQGIRKLTGFKKGGIVGDSISNYASYESYGNNLVLAVQPMIIKKEVIVEQQIPIPFPMASGVNNSRLSRG